jgi:ABC-type nitrate/sulfonate/bicarbonate transport system substrate-binding protein
MAFAELRIIYRSNSHAPLWVVAEKSGVWEKNSLVVNTSPQLVREKAVEALRNGHVDLISGNHHNLYVRNAKGEDFVHLAQAGNNWTENRLVVAHGIRSVMDLTGKKVAVDKLTSHAGLNVWLFLRQEGLDADRGDVDLVELRGPAEERWKRVLSGEFAGTFVTLPHDTRAERAGAHVIRVRAMPMIRGVTLTTTMSFVKNHEAKIRLLIRGFVDAIHFFITRRQETLEILKEHASPILHLQSDEEVETLYEEWAHSLERKPYPAIEAIANVFRLAVRRNPEIASFNPLALWDSHYVRELDDSGYIDQLYQQKRRG